MRRKGEGESSFAKAPEDRGGKQKWRTARTIPVLAFRVMMFQFFTLIYLDWR
jgi:hypothetical protein